MCTCKYSQIETLNVVDSLQFNSLKYFAFYFFFHPVQRKHLNINEVNAFYWIDSMITRHWIEGKAKTIQTVKLNSLNSCISYALFGYK